MSLRPLLLVALLAGCASSPPVSTPPPAAAKAEPAPAPAPEKPKPTYGSFGFDTAGMDRSVAPGDDFYRYANGTWLDRTEIPADRTAFGMFTTLAIEAEKRTRAIIENAASAAEGTEERKLGDYFAAFMDEATIESKGLTPLKPELERIAAIQDRKALSSYLGETLRADVDVLNTADTETDRLFGLWISEDLDDPSKYAPYLLQGGLGLPDRDYYLADNPRFAELRTKYQQHIARMLTLAQVPNAEAKAKAIYELEKKIAQAHWSATDTQDTTKSNNPWKREEFAKKAPGLDWNAYFTAAGLADQPVVRVWQASAITGIAKLAGAEKLQTWKDYLTFRALARAAPFLPKAFVDESWAFNAQTLAGAKQMRDRWKRGVDFADAALGEVIGKAYVAKYFPPEAKQAADTMVRNIIAAFDQRIDGLEWMSPQTKAKAKEKLKTLKVGIGHTEKWRDYSGLEVKRDDAYGNAHRAGRFELQYQLSKLGKPVEKGEWFMNPQLVNALNSPQQNSIIFPAAILQPPFFDANADPAVNYGGIGSVIGHEIVHSFDDMGAQFDANGKIANWWTEADLRQFKAAGQRLVAQYNAYKPFPDLGVNGELTLGENIADVAGLAIALDGYKLSLGGKDAEVLEGFTGEQRVFLGFAQVWRTKYREPTLRRLLTTDGHSPGPYRALTVRNSDAWYGAFDVKPGQKLFLATEDRVRVW